jgi:hypothetical protein
VSSSTEAKMIDQKTLWSASFLTRMWKIISGTEVGDILFAPGCGPPVDPVVGQLEARVPHHVCIGPCYLGATNHGAARSCVAAETIMFT